MIEIFYIDLRGEEPVYRKGNLEWRAGLTARQAVVESLGEAIASEAVQGLQDNNRELRVGWFHIPSGDSSEMGGCGTLDWTAEDKTHIVIDWWPEHPTREQLDASSDWMYENVIYLLDSDSEA